MHGFAATKDVCVKMCTKCTVSSRTSSFQMPHRSARAQTQVEAIDAADIPQSPTAETAQNRCERESNAQMRLKLNRRAVQQRRILTRKYGRAASDARREKSPSTAKSSFMGSKKGLHSNSQTKKRKEKERRLQTG
eukprot:2590843-Pleurochrysis_carterae.AAC.2